MRGKEVKLRLATGGREADIPFSSCLLNERTAVLAEKAAIDGDGINGGIPVSAGAAGVIKTPLTINCAPLLLAAMFGGCDTGIELNGSMSAYGLSLRSAGLSYRFDLTQERGDRMTVYPGCVCTAFELKAAHEQAVYARFRVASSERLAMNNEQLVKAGAGVKAERAAGVFERFSSRGVDYFVNGVAMNSVYGSRVSVSKTEGEAACFVDLERRLRGRGLPGRIRELTITARLFRARYGNGTPGFFVLRFTDLAAVRDMAVIDKPGSLFGTVRYVVLGSAGGEVYAEGAADLV
jgi:hypothetical protein